MTQEMTSPCTTVATHQCYPSRDTLTGMTAEELAPLRQIPNTTPEWLRRLGRVAQPLRATVRQPLRIETRETFREAFEIEVDVIEGDWIELER